MQSKINTVNNQQYWLVAVPKFDGYPAYDSTVRIVATWTGFAPERVTNGEILKRYGHELKSNERFILMSVIATADKKHEFVPAPPPPPEKVEYLEIQRYYNTH